MNFFAFSALVVAIASFASSFFVLWKNPNGKKNRAYQLLGLSATGWSFFYFLWQMSETYDAALFFIRISIAFAAFIPVATFHAYLEILEANTPRRIKFRNLLYVTTFIIILSSPTPYFIPALEARAGFPYWPLPGPFIHLHFINLFTPSVWVIYLIWEQRKKASSPLIQNKLKWLLFATLIGYGGGMTNNFLWYNIPIKPYISILSLLVPVTPAALFFRLAVIDFNYLLKKLSVYSISLFITTALAYVLVVPFSQKPLPILIPFATIFGSISFVFIKVGVDYVIRRFTRGGLNQTTLQMTREKIKEVTYTYKDLATNIVNLIMNTFPVEMAAVYFYDMRHKEYVLFAQKGMKNELTGNILFNRSALSVKPDDPLILHMEEIKTYVQMEALLNNKEEIKVQPLIASLNRLEAEICSPFLFGNKLRGLLVIGGKKDNTLFNDEEKEALISFSQMGTDVMRHLMAVETELNHTALYSHDINHDIRSLTQTIQFLESPMAAQMTEEKRMSLLKQAENVADRLYESFQLNRDRSTMIMKMIRGDYERKPVNISKIVAASVEKFRLQAEKSNVKLLTDISSSNLPVNGNDLDLTRLIDNLISNAFRYLPENNAQLSVSGKPLENGYEIRIKDNGEGIEPADTENIWQLGWQASGDKKKGSAGFGLAIVKQIVQVHDGTIQAISQGKGTGLEFKIFFPTLTSESKDIA